MSDTKVYQFGETGNSSLNALLPFLQQRGIDPSYLYGLMGNNGFFGGNGIEGIIGLIVVLALIGGFNGNGNGLFGGNGNNNNGNNYAYDALLSAIQRNGTDISQLAQTVGISSDRIHDAIGQVSTQICNLAGQNGMSFQQVTNAILSGNAQLSSQLAQCCCSIEKGILESNYLTERGFCNTNQILTKGFSDIGYAFRDQTCNLEKSGSANTAAIIAKLDAIEDSRKDRELAEKDRMIATLTARSERQAELQPIYSALHELQCNQPEVAKIPYIPAAGNYLPVNYSVPMHFGVSNYGGCGYNYGC